MGAGTLAASAVAGRGAFKNLARRGLGGGLADTDGLGLRGRTVITPDNQMRQSWLRRRCETNMEMIVFRSVQVVFGTAFRREPHAQKCSQSSHGKLAPNLEE